MIALQEYCVRILLSFLLQGIQSIAQTLTLFILTFRFQAQAYIHKKVTQKTKDMRKSKKSKLASALAEVASKTQSQKMVDESSQIINTVANVSSAINNDDEEEETDEWFEEENLSCDPGAGIMNMLSKCPA